MHTTPLLVNTTVNSMTEYVGSLAKTGRKNYTATMKKNKRLTYSLIEYEPKIIQHFMLLWEQQYIRGKKRKWGFGLEFVEFLNKNNNLMCFAAYEEDDGNEIVVAVHFVEKHGAYVECHPPMYEKELYSDDYIAKYMWFKLIEFAIENEEIEWIDLGGGNRGTWKDLLMDRKNHPKIKYKWLYVPSKIKESPDTQLDYEVFTVWNEKQYHKYITCDK